MVPPYQPGCWEQTSAQDSHSDVILGSPSTRTSSLRVGDSVVIWVLNVVGKCTRQMYILSLNPESRMILLGGHWGGGWASWVELFAHSPMIGCRVGVVERKSFTSFLLRWSVYLRMVSFLPPISVPGEGLGCESFTAVGIVNAPQHFLHWRPLSIEATST